MRMKYMVCITESNLNLGLYIFLEYGNFDLNVFLSKDDKSSLSAFSWETSEKFISNIVIEYILIPAKHYVNLLKRQHFQLHC